MHAQILFSLPLYMQKRAFDGNAFVDYALTCIFVGLPLGAICGGFVIQRTHRNRLTMIVNSILTVLIYVLFATEIISLLHSITF